MPSLFWVAIGGACGAVFRSILSALPARLTDTPFPFGTLLVNLLGCFLMGFLWAYLDQKDLPDFYQPLLTTGFLGALTTFSTFSLDNFKLMEQGAFFALFLNLMVSCGVGLCAVWLGVQIARTLS